MGIDNLLPTLQKVIPLWVLIGLFTFFIFNAIIKDKKYIKFYAHPSIGLNHFMRDDKSFKLGDKIFVNVCLNFLYIPLSVIWIICWLLFKSWHLLVADSKKVKIDSRSESKGVEEEKPMLDARLEEPDLLNDASTSIEVSQEQQVNIEEPRIEEPERSEVTSAEPEVTDNVENKEISIAATADNTVTTESKPKRKYTKRKKPEPTTKNADEREDA